MWIHEHASGDRLELRRWIAQERDAEQRDRYRAVSLALAGEQKQTIQRTLDRSKRFVERWVYRYRDHGLEAVAPKPRGGSHPRLAETQQERFIERFKAGPTEADGPVCAFRGKDAIRLLKEEFGVEYTLSGVYKLLHRHGLSFLKPRPQHRYNDPEAMQRWRDGAPFLSNASVNSTPIDKSRSGSRMRRASGRRAR